MVPPPRLNLNGYTDLPPGKVATVVTFLEMRTRPRLRREPTGRQWRLEVIGLDLERYRALFRRVGEDWLWFSRLIMPDGALAGILGHPKIEAYALREGGADLGLLELDFRSRRAAQLAFFGLVPEAIGSGAGRHLMNEAIRRAFRRPIGRLFVHTCSLDHPSALPFYLRSGFTAYRRAIEVADDPRLLGALPLEAAPQIPVIARRVPAKRPRQPALATGRRAE
jgi:GNAT superfamily N-acetyltransferase